MERLAHTVQAVTDESVDVAFVDRGYTGERAVTGAGAGAGRDGIKLEVVRLPDARRSFVLLPRRWVVERSFAWATRFRRLVKNCERLPETLAGLHVVAFARLMLKQLLTPAASS